MSKLTFQLSASERSALLSILIEHWQGCDNCTEEFVDVSTDPPTTVRYGDLLGIFAQMNVPTPATPDPETEPQ